MSKHAAEQALRAMLGRVVPGARIYFPRKRSPQDHIQFTWNGRHLHPSGETLESQIHDVAHVLIASKSRRQLPECGLGPDPYRPSDAPRTIADNVCYDEEGLACALQAALCLMLGLDYEAAEREVNVDRPTLDKLAAIKRYAPDALSDTLWHQLRAALRGHFLQNGEKCWCVASLERDERGRVTGEKRWCALGRNVYGKWPQYRDHEPTACCDMRITLPVGYEFRVPTCPDRSPE